MSRLDIKYSTFVSSQPTQSFHTETDRWQHYTETAAAIVRAVATVEDTEVMSLVFLGIRLTGCVNLLQLKMYTWWVFNGLIPVFFRLLVKKRMNNNNKKMDSPRVGAMEVGLMISLSLRSWLRPLRGKYLIRNLSNRVWMHNSGRNRSKINKLLLKIHKNKKTLQTLQYIRGSLGLRAATSNMGK